MFIRLIIASLCVLLLSCKTAQTSNSDEPSVTKSSKKFDNLAKITLIDFLRNQPGIRINGSGSHYKILIRGHKSIQGNNDPLYVLDGVPIGRNYNDANMVVDVTQVESLKVIPPPRAGRYGSRGQNGVIEIKTKSK